jgi:E3 ubiquitin-protein ligase HUWE1
MVVSMGFSERIARKAIRRIEIPEPTMILDFILQGKVSDDEEEEEPP